MSGAGWALPRRLGIGVVPAQGESFPSWVDRMAVRMRTGPGWVVRELGIELMPDRSMVIPLNYGISMSRRDLEAVHSATGVAPDAVSAMLLSLYDGTVLDLSSLGRSRSGGDLNMRSWGLFRGSRCCPDCVATSAGAWQLWWRLGGAAACPEHQILLHGRCPRCRLPLRWGTYWLSVPTPYPESGLSACLNQPAGSRSVCGFPLGELPSRPVPTELLEVQDLYLRAAAGRALPLAGKETGPAIWFAEMSEMVALARMVGPHELPGLDEIPVACAQAWHDDHAVGKAQKTRQWRGCPPSPELAAALLQALSPVLRAASEPELRNEASWLISAASRRRPGSRGIRPLDPIEMPPFTRRAFMTSKHRGKLRVSLAKVLHREPHLVGQGLTVAHIPCYANEDDVLEHVTPHLALKQGQGAIPGGWPQRRFAALCLARLVSDARNWGDVAAELGQPSLGVNGNPAYMYRIADLLVFREGLIVLGNRLVERGLVDYRTRRAALAGLTEMPADDWAGRPGRGTKPEFRDHGRVSAAAWIWSELTGGRFDESPAWAAYPEFSAPATAAASVGFYNRWLRRQGPARRDWLRSWGARYLAERGTA